MFTTTARRAASAALTSLTEPLAGVAAAPAAALAGATSRFAVGTVAAVAAPSAPCSGVALVVEAPPAAGGAAFLLKHVGLGSTGARSDIKLSRDLEDAGCSATVTAARGAVVYHVECSADALGVAAEALAEAAFATDVDAWELEDAKKWTVAADVKAAQSSPLTLAFEALHEAAYGAANPMGAPHFATAADAKAVAAFRASSVANGRVTLVGLGADADALLAAAAAPFGAAPASAGAAPAAGSCCAFVAGGTAHVAGVGGPDVVAVGMDASGADAATQKVIEAAFFAKTNGAAFVTDYGLFGAYGTDAAALKAALAAPLSDADIASAASAAAARLGAETCPVAVARALANPDAPSPAAVAAVTPAAVKAAVAAMQKAAPAVAVCGDAHAVPAGFF